MKTPRGARTPVIVVTGFLGSGKTTLIRSFLASPAGRNTAIVVNEFGEIGLDHVLLRTGSEATVLMGNGCLCCSMRSDLEVTLRELLADAESGRIPGFERVVVETSGLADPGPILTTFSADRGIAREFVIETVLTLVDAVNGQDALDQAPEARHQVALADRLVVTKTDLAGTTDALVARLRDLNPNAEIVRVTNGEAGPELWSPAALVPREQIQEKWEPVFRPDLRREKQIQEKWEPVFRPDLRGEDSDRSRQPASLAAPRGRPQAFPGEVGTGSRSGNALEEWPARGRALDEAHDHAHHSEGIETFVITLDRPTTWAKLSAALDVLMRLRGQDLLRVKGLVALEECKGPVVLQAVQHVLSPPAELSDWPADHPDHTSRLVFITRRLPKEQVTGLLAGILGL